MAFKKIQEYITTEDGVAGTRLIPRIILPTMIEEVEKVLLPRELAAMVWGPSQIQGPTLPINLETPDSIIVREIGEGGEIAMDNMEFTSTTVTPIKYGTAIRITREMMEDSQFELLQRNIRAVGRRLAENETKLVLTVLDGTANDITGGAALTIANITTAMKNVEDNDFVPTDIVIGNEAAFDIRNIDTFVEADKSGSTEMLQRGFIGRIYGLPVTRFSPAATATPATTTTRNVYVFDRNETYGIAIKRDISVENFDLPTYDMQGAVVTQRIVVVLLRSAAVSRVTTT